MSKFIVGKTVQQVKIADDKKALLFVCDDGEHIVKIDGDCCSDSWIEHVELPALGFPAEVLSVSNLDLPGSCENHSDYECLAVYGCKISTDKGDMVIDYRNSSNGYYGGDIVWPDEYFYGGVYNQNVSSLQWVDIEE